MSNFKRKMMCCNAYNDASNKRDIYFLIEKVFRVFPNENFC